MNEELQLSLENEPVFKIALSTNVAATFQTWMLTENKNLCYQLQQVKMYNEYLMVLRKVTRKIAVIVVATNYLKH